MSTGDASHGKLAASVWLLGVLVVPGVMVPVLFRAPGVPLPSVDLWTLSRVMHRTRPALCVCPPRIAEGIRTATRPSNPGASSGDIVLKTVSASKGSVGQIAIDRTESMGQ